MMEQESKQVQKAKENSWQDLTAKKMAELMANKGLLQEWKKLKKSININDADARKEKERRINSGEIKKEDTYHKFNGEVMSLLTYFLTFIAAMNEKEGGNQFQDPNTVGRIGKTYNLELFCTGEESYCDFEYYIGQIIPADLFPKKSGYSFAEQKKARKDRCWQRILVYLAELAEEEILGPQNRVIDVFDWLDKRNAEAWKDTREVFNNTYDSFADGGPKAIPITVPKDREENRMDSYEKCKTILDNWWKENRNTLLECAGESVEAESETNPPAEDVPDPLKGNEFAKKARDRIEQGVKQIIFTGAPGTGKTYAAKLIAECMGTKLPGYPDPYKLVQFHPSYDYTDFVEGLRPVVRTGEKEVSFVKLDGQFKAFCRKVVDEGDPAKKYFFLIDEINRADLSKVFGELMFCLESDKRGKKVDTQYQNLPTYVLTKEGEPERLTRMKDPNAPKPEPGEDAFSDGFYVPENVYIIGTMNDIDRSVESMDFALRRRFDWMEAVVDKKMLEDALPHVLQNPLEGMGETQVKTVAKNLADSVVRLNDVIKSKGGKYGLTRQHFISQGQFANLPKLSEGQTAEAVKKHVWKYRLEPLLREYLRGEPEESIDEFINGQKRRQDVPQKKEDKVCCKDAFEVKDES